MPTNTFINLPVTHLDKTIDFFTQLGFTFNSEYTDEKAACMILHEHCYVMFLLNDYFKSFTVKEIPDTSKINEAIISLSFDTKEEVDIKADTAFKAGAIDDKDVQNQTGMYIRRFQDLDGHQWELFVMAPKAHIQQ